jgi:hypothetical protein
MTSFDTFVHRNLSAAGAARRRAVRRLASCCLAFAGVLGISAPASAQIYSWRDGNGNLVLSNTQKPPVGTPSHTYLVPKALGVLATTYVPTDRVQTYDDLIVEHAQLNDIRPDLIRAVVQVESAYNARATSPKGAMGLMQLMPATARRLGVRNPYSPADNVRGGVAYLRELLDRYDGNEQLALAAYNAGPGAVSKYGQRVPPYRETLNYVVKVNKLAGARKATSKKLPAAKIYQVTRVVEGREVVYFTDQKPPL